MKHPISALCAAACLAAVSFPAAAQNLAIVNGKPVPKARYDETMRLLKDQADKTGRPLRPDVSEQLRKNLIDSAVLVQAAEQRGLNTTREFATRLQGARDEILIRMLFDQYRREHPVTDQEARAIYDKALGGNGTEYHAHHILVKTEADAQKVLQELKKGASFEALAKKYSLDPGSGKRGGDLDWSPASNYVPEFSKALTELKKGQTTATPVKTQFGYHIIRLDDTRSAPVPPFEQVKPQIVQEAEQQRLVEFQQSLVSKARIQDLNKKP